MDDIRSITCRCERSLLSSPLFLPLSSLLSARAHLTLVSQRRGETDRSRRTGTETMEGKRDERGLDSHRRCTHSPLLSSHPHDSANHLTQHVSLVHHPSTPCISCPLLSSPSPLFSISTSDPRSLFPHPPFDSLRHQQWPGTEAKMSVTQHSTLIHCSSDVALHSYDTCALYALCVTSGIRPASSVRRVISEAIS